MMDGAGEQLFAGAALAEEQNGGVRDGNFLDLLADFANGSIFAKDARKAVAGRIFFAKNQIFPEQLLLAGGAADKQFQMLQVHGLLQKVESAFFHGGDGFVDGTEGGEQQDGDGGVGLLGFA
jgi:hypothetical protein